MRQVRLLAKRFVTLLCSAVLLLNILTGVVAADVKGCPEGMSQLDCAAVLNGWENWIPEDGSACTTSSEPVLAGADNKAKAYNYFVDKGLDEIQASAIVGNLIAESSLNTSADQPNGAGMGIAQWGNPGRWNTLEQFAADQGRDKFSLGLQLDFIWHELQGGYAKVLDNLKKQTTIEDATAWFMGTALAGIPPGTTVDPVTQSYIDKYGRFGGYEDPGTPHLDIRIKAAQLTQQSFGSGGVSGTENTSSEGCISGTPAESFNVATYNLLDAEAHPDDSRSVGGCNRGDSKDPLCINARTSRQAQIITGGGNPAFDVVGTQETSPKQYTALKAALTNYDVYPTNNSGLSNGVDGETAIWWNKDAFSLAGQGKVAQLSNIDKKVSAPWVELQTSGGHKIFFLSVHYANTTFGGSVEEHKAAAKLTLDFVKAHQTAGPVFVVGDFNEHFEQGPVPKATVPDAAYCALTADGIMQNLYDMGKDNPIDKPCPTKSNPGPNYINGGKDQMYVTPASDLSSTGWTQPGESGIYAQASDHMPVYASMNFAAQTSTSVSCGGTTQSNLREAVVCLAQAELALWKSGQMGPGHDFFKYSENVDELWCADFASWIFKQAGYPIGPSASNWRVPSVQGIKQVGEDDKKFHYHDAAGYTPKPGDLVIHLSGQSHVNIATSVNSNTHTLTMIGGDQTHGNGGADNNIVSEYSVHAFSGTDGITGYVSPD
jgi:hypothetical protein